MRILVVDNVNTGGMHSLTNALKDYPHDLMRYNKISARALSKYDKIILSGGHAFGVLHPRAKYKKELEMVKRSRRPILGICLGFQLICRAYGAQMTDLKTYEKRVLRIKKLDADPMLKGVPESFLAFEYHRHLVTAVSHELIPLAISNDGIEMVKHRSKPIWGTQFHPDKLVKRTTGRKILYNFLNA
jgi:anthranilate/para-aminobenzoate synthase component II